MSGSDLLKVLKDMLKDVLKGETNRTVDPHVGRDPKDLSPLSTTPSAGVCRVDSLFTFLPLPA